MKRLELLEKSLEKKEKELDRRFDNCFDHIKQTNGQPMNDKRNGKAFFNKVEKNDNAIRNQMESVKKTKNAIDREKSRLNYKEKVIADRVHLPQVVQDLINDGTLNQWMIYPDYFFVNGIEKFRINIKQKKTKKADWTFFHKFGNTVASKEDRNKINEILKLLRENLNK